MKVISFLFHFLKMCFGKRHEDRTDTVVVKPFKERSSHLRDLHAEPFPPDACHGPPREEQQLPRHTSPTAGHGSNVSASQNSKV